MPGNDELKFRVNCHAGDHGCLRVATDTLIVNVGQQFLCDGHVEHWDSVLVKCSEEGYGGVMVRVLCCSPDWEEPLQIACLRSWPDAGSMNQPALVCDLWCDPEA